MYVSTDHAYYLTKLTQRHRYIISINIHSNEISIALKSCASSMLLAYL